MKSKLIDTYIHSLHADEEFLNEFRKYYNQELIKEMKEFSINYTRKEIKELMELNMFMYGKW